MRSLMVSCVRGIWNHRRLQTMAMAMLLMMLYLEIIRDRACLKVRQFSICNISSDESEVRPEVLLHVMLALGSFSCSSATEVLIDQKCVQKYYSLWCCLLVLVAIQLSMFLYTLLLHWNFCCRWTATILQALQKHSSVYCCLLLLVAVHLRQKFW